MRQQSRQLPHVEEKEFQIHDSCWNNTARLRHPRYDDRLNCYLVVLVVLAMFLNGSVAAEEVECLHGFGGNDEVMTIPSSWINDGYCDCPVDGKDEYATNACSGSSKFGGNGWAGVTTSTAVTKNDDSSEIFYSCPLQPKKKLPLSRMNDGICDCCDGSDETNNKNARAATTCIDICDQVLAKEREEREKMRQKFTIGYDQRNQELAKFQELVRSTYEKTNSIEKEVFEIATKDTQLLKEITSIQLELLQNHFARVQSRISTIGYTPTTTATTTNGISGMFDTLTNDEIINFIIHSCQMAGEMDDIVSQYPTKSCVPLRFAGMDSGILWEDGREDNPKDTMDQIAKVDRYYHPYKTNEEENNTKMVMLSQILYWNSIHEDTEKVWSMKEYNKRNKNSKNKNTPPKHRKLIGMDDEDDYDEDDYEDDYPYPDDDHYEDDLEDDYDARYGNRYGGSRKNHQRKGNNNKDEPTGKKKEYVDAIKGNAFSKSRTAFIEHANGLIHRIGELLKPDEDDGDDNEDEGEGEDEEGKAEEDVAVEEDVPATDEEASDEVKNFDPVAYQMVQNTLRGHVRSIETGIDYAVSAKFLLDSMLQQITIEEQQEQLVRKDLISLAVGTLYYSQLSAVHVWQIIVGVIPELKNESKSEEAQEETCALPDYLFWQVESCPPRSTERTIINDTDPNAAAIVVRYPPQGIVHAIEAQCESDGPLLSSQLYQEPSTCEESSSLQPPPTNVPDGYYGYFKVTPRDTASDIISQSFSNWETMVNSEIKLHVASLESESDELKKNKNRLEREMDDLKENIGHVPLSSTEENSADTGYDSKFGLNGELHAIKDDCYSVEAGKYIYEVCMFGKSAQKDRDQPKSSGTSLGQWTGIEYVDRTVDGEPTTNQRVLKWENGQACWNGPRRSSTVYVTCGSETKVLSAEEPDTCRYVLVMESHIACDDAYKTLHGL